MLDPNGDPEHQRELVEIAREGYERLSGFIESALSYFRRLADTSDVVKIPVDLSLVVQAVVDRYEGRQFKTNLAEPAWVLTCPQEIDLVVTSLIDNAIKFSDGCVRVDMRIDDAVTLIVVDEGGGFDPDRADDLFRPFSVADVDHHARGTGLSLPLAKAIVEQDGGSIVAFSEGLGKGATFTVTLPVTEPDTDSE